MLITRSLFSTRSVSLICTFAKCFTYFYKTLINSDVSHLLLSYFSVFFFFKLGFYFWYNFQCLPRSVIKIRNIFHNALISCPKFFSNCLDIPEIRKTSLPDPPLEEQKIGTAYLVKIDSKYFLRYHHILLSNTPYIRFIIALSRIFQWHLNWHLFLIKPLSCN